LLLLKLFLAAAVTAEKQYGPASMYLQEDQLGVLLAKKDESAFEQVFKTYFKNLHAYAFTIVRDETEAEEIVQQVFFKMWERADNLSFSGSIASYLYRAVYNESLNHIKHLKVKTKHRLHVAYSMKNPSETAPEKASDKELRIKLREALSELPEQCSIIFQLSRFEELKYREIADKLDISVKTVENQMGKALKLLRIKLAEFLLLAITLINF